MKARSVGSIRDALERGILRQTFIGFAALAVVSAAATYLLFRYETARGLEKSATAVAMAFRNRILEGDAKAVETQIHDVLGLSDDEKVYILDRDLKPIYRSDAADSSNIQPCSAIGATCFGGLSSSGRIALPIYFDEARSSLFGYLYLTRSAKIDWFYLLLVFSVFAGGSVSVLLGTRRVARGSSKMLAARVEDWALRLRRDPKTIGKLDEAPFAELVPLQEAIEGLTDQIAVYENRAGEKATELILRGIAHDLISPVSQIQLYLATLEQQMKFNSGAEDTLTEIKLAFQKLRNTATQVKALNETSSSGKPTAFATAVKAEVDVLRKSDAVSSKNLSLNLEIESEDVHSLLTETEVSRIVQNLVENAAAASNPNATIDIGIGVVGANVVLSVKDMGQGVPIHMQERVFDPDVTSKPATGTGLGLYIVKQICGAKHGTVQLLSSKKTGTIFTVSVPTAESTGATYGA
ncbi:MAG: HAMP domain-containing histidine kinase [Bdellovibrionaceae bacterium]|nr:HAMP domain-containing histidine kinase [Pseudobdellovibrionaceae bacterium]